MDSPGRALRNDENGRFIPLCKGRNSSLSLSQCVGILYVSLSFRLVLVASTKYSRDYTRYRQHSYVAGRCVLLSANTIL